MGFYRFPTLHENLVVFAAEGDLWRVPVSGGLAQRLTTHHGEERSPQISPDGSMLAFTAQYEGPTAVYTMPLAGGAPVRRTWTTDPALVDSWTPDGELVFTTTAYSTLPSPQAVKLDPATNATERVPLYTATETEWSGEGGPVFFSRPAYHNNVTRRYTGGTARDIWRFDAGSPEAVELTGDYDGESHSPMLWQDRVYFVTDRDGTMNVWSMDPTGTDLRQHTRHSAWDVKNPDLQGGRIVYQVGADLWVYDIEADTSAMIPITLASDFDQLREKWVENPEDYITSAQLHPEGKSLVLTARGRVFVVPVDRSGRLVQASRAQGVRYRDAVFMPDGDRIAVLSDASGEFEWVTLPADGVGEPQALTDDGTILRFNGVPSPDGTRLAYTDNNNDMWVLDISSGGQTRISQTREGSGGASWSPDGRWLAFSESGLNTFRVLKLYDTRSGDVTPITSTRMNSVSPGWDADGDFLYFLSDRNLVSLVGSPWGSRQPEPFFDRQWQVFHLAMKDGLRSPFSPANELTEASDAPEDGASDSGDGGQGGDPAVEIDLNGIRGRLQRVPVPAGNYSTLEVGLDALYFLDRDSGPGASRHVKAVPLSPPDSDPVVTVVENAQGLDLSADRKKLLVTRGSGVFVIDARPRPATDLGDHRVDLSDWRFSIDVVEDFRQMFIDAWRMERDYFYDPGMHGNDWDAILDRFMPLVDRVTTRDELSDLIGRYVGELSALHTSVRGGDLRNGEDDIRVGSLGARIIRDAAAGGDRIEHVYQTDPDFPDEMSPLAHPEVNAGPGDVILALNGTDVLSVPHLGVLLRGQAGEPVRLRIRGADGEEREVMATPVPNESNLRYSEWEYTRRLAVEEASGGSIGYVHMRAMGGGNLTEWYRNYYPVFNRQGLIVDMRRNRGGNIDSFILEKLMREAWMYWKSRAGQTTWNMQYAFRGHMVVLVDQETASDGEAFADGFRRLGLGPVIGARTWGGEIWLGSQNRLSDGGLARAPMMGVFGPEGEWLIEQVGVVPDIEVDNLPHETFNGRDRQLETAIEYLLQRIAEDPRPVPEPPPFPNRAFRYPSPPPGGGS
jgi:tricorn protease